MSTLKTKIVLSRLDGTDWTRKGLRPFLEYRDLGLAEATEGRIGGTIGRAIKKFEPGGGAGQVRQQAAEAHQRARRHRREAAWRRRLARLPNGHPLAATMSMRITQGVVAGARSAATASIALSASAGVASPPPPLKACAPLPRRSSR